jgi:hypothetical protein
LYKGLNARIFKANAIEKPRRRFPNAHAVVTTAFFQGKPFTADAAQTGKVEKRCMIVPETESTGGRDDGVF